MGLETFTGIWSFNSSWPVGASDLKSAGDEHLRGIKAALLTTFPNIGAAVNATHTELNRLVGVAGALAVLNVANVFAANQTIQTAGLPEFGLWNTGAPTDRQRWCWQIENDGDLALFPRLNSGSGVENAVTFRSNNLGEVTEVALTADVISVNGQDVRNAALFNAGTLGLARGGTGQTTQLGITREVTKAWTIQADPGGTPGGTAGDVFAYY